MDVARSIRPQRTAGAALPQAARHPALSPTIHDLCGHTRSSFLHAKRSGAAIYAAFRRSIQLVIACGYSAGACNMGVTVPIEAFLNGVELSVSLRC
jgi:hypothetical protein